MNDKGYSRCVVGSLVLVYIQVMYTKINIVDACLFFTPKNCRKKQEYYNDKFHLEVPSN